MNNTEWLNKYRTDKHAVWIKCKLTNGEEYFYPHYRGWEIIKRKCDKQSIFIEEFYLQFRSHEEKIDLTDAEAVYFIRSLMGRMGGKTNEYYSTGILKDGIMHKQMWLVPELIIEKELNDDLDECFEEAIIYKPV